MFKKHNLRFILEDLSVSMGMEALKSRERREPEGKEWIKERLRRDKIWPEACVRIPKWGHDL